MLSWLLFFIEREKKEEKSEVQHDENSKGFLLFLRAVALGVKLIFGCFRRGEGDGDSCDLSDCDLGRFVSS